MKKLILILGDQLTTRLSSLQDANIKNDIILMCEVWDEATYVKHHKKKIAFLFSAMRHFADELKEAGFNIVYTKLNDKNNANNFFGEVQKAVKKFKITNIIVTEPGEYRVLSDMKQWHTKLKMPVEIRPDDRFFCSINEFSDWAGPKKNLRMEFFYRYMRKKHNILMKNDKPIGEKWNFDADNRKPPNTKLSITKPIIFKPDQTTQEVIHLVEQQFADHFGDLEPFSFAVTQKQAKRVLNDFIKNKLNYFGDYQDAMLEDEPFMFHSTLSFYINCGLLDPRDCVNAAEKAYYDNGAPLNCVEAFIRQIIGWREYVRGIYWLQMPEYKNKNFFQAKCKLPDFFWTGDTTLNCLKQCITETKQNAYAHHIQRLMVLGNFLLLTGVDPHEVNEWYLIVFADAYEWVELPNVTGMILFADGGLLASKPYAAGGAYINKMSNYCKNCQFKVSVKNGEEACPFNYLYWNFLIKNKSRLKDNPRLGMMYNLLSKMDKAKLNDIQQDSKRFLDALKQ